MSDIVIKAENLGKKYTIGHQSENGRYLALRDVLVQNARSLWHKTKDLVQGKPILQGDTLEDVWALKDVSFEIRRGEAVGIIGRNGAGKSTLLKVLSRITEPSAGRVTIKGGVASLLEVGTGFHPELTGRENIYLNGAILGMQRAEIKRKFDEIVAFAEIEKFLDTPVKRYSSGMYVRLAFAVAAHLEPEILVVDEVLAVGDAAFQKKCLGKMEEVSAREGRTVLFVSHQMGAIAQFCNKAFLLSEGRIVQSGAVQQVVNYYMNLSPNGVVGYEGNSSSLLKDIAIIKAQSYDADGASSANFTHTQEILIAITCKVNRRVNGAEVRIAVRDSKRRVFTTDTKLITQEGQSFGVLCANVVIPGGLLRPEHYFITLATYLPNQMIFDLAEDALSFTVIDGGSKYAASEGLDYGCVFVDCKWSVAEIHQPPERLRERQHG
jgi:lipopolysaccharide transport system ATP-binding protein